MRPRARTAVVLALACAAALPACGTSDQDEVRAVAQEFRRALEAGDGARACRLLTANAKRQLDGDCARRILMIDPGDPASDGALTLRDDRASLATRSGGRTRAIAFIKTDDGWRLDDVPLSTAVHDPRRAAFYERCWRDAGARIAKRASDLAFAAAGGAAMTSVREDTVSAKGDDWRIFYTLAGTGSDPGLADVIADPRVAGAVAYVEQAGSRADVVERARACMPD